jgi:aminoglycoside/choline kinase family phosphotransferase
MEDLGNTLLQDRIRHTKKEDTVLSYYRLVVDHLIRMNTAGAENFDLSWAYQTPSYSKDVILEKECRYFVEAFINGFLGWQVSYDKFEPEFIRIAESALNHAVTGLMHRDFQSRNIMVKNERVYFIDFQGARIGPIQYDLASLLIDPYVCLPIDIQDQIFKYCLESLSAVRSIDPDHFSCGYFFCALARNLQILGAFAHLSRNCHKKQFAEYIPQAVESLKRLIGNISKNQFPRLRTLVEKITV